MSFSLTVDDRKQQFEAENVALNNTVSAFNMAELIDQEHTAYMKEKKLAVLEDQLTPKQVVGLAHRQNVDYVIQNSLQPFSEKVKILNAIDRDKKEFFREEFSFFIDPVCKHKIIFDSNTPRKTILNLTFHRLEIDIDASRSQNLKTALEEMIMNAQIDARILGNQTANLKSTLILEKKDKLVAASIIDLYGTLTYSKFIGQIESVLEIGFSNSINHNRARGAGIGSSIIFNASDSLYLGCLPSEKTRVTAVIPVGLSETKQEKLQKSIFLL